MRDAESPRTGWGAALLRREWIVLPTLAVASVDAVVLSFRPTALTPARAPSLSSEAHRRGSGSSNE
jgi:hypothetical protein